MDAGKNWRSSDNQDADPGEIEGSLDENWTSHSLAVGERRRREVSRRRNGGSTARRPSPASYRDSIQIQYGGDTWSAVVQWENQRELKEKLKNPAELGTGRPSVCSPSLKE